VVGLFPLEGESKNKLPHDADLNVLDDEAEGAASSEVLVAGSLSEKSLLSTGIRIGTLIKTKSMLPFISRTKADGLHVIDVNKTLARVDIAGKFIARSEDLSKVVVYSSREYGRTPVEKFCEVTGATPLTGRFMPGTFTNPLFPNHIDPEIVVVTDPAVDSQAIDEASKIGVPVIAICDTDNVTANVDLVIPANNRGRRALAAVFWLLARSVLLSSRALAADQPMRYSIEDFETKLLEEEEEGGAES
jgi:small subunit ribosomal protein S2